MPGSHARGPCDGAARRSSPRRPAPPARCRAAPAPGPPRVDLRTERALHAARHDGDALLDLRGLGKLRGLGPLRPGREPDARHRAQPPRQDHRNGRADPGQQQADAHQLRPGHHLGNGPAQNAFAQRTGVMFLDMGAGLVHQPLVIDAGGAGRLAVEAGEAAVDVIDLFLWSGRRPSPACPSSARCGRAGCRVHRRAAHRWDRSRCRCRNGRKLRIALVAGPSCGSAICSAVKAYFIPAFSS